MHTLFISDLHLSPERPDRLALFKQFLAGHASRARALYILGDLFDQFWVGNDDRTPPNAEIINALREFTATGTPLYFMRGNRELIIDAGFERLTGATLLPDGSVIDLDGAPTLIMHGDVLCTRDRNYQAFRRFAKCRFNQRVFAALPYRARTFIAHGLRPAMRRAAARKASAIIDVEQSAVESALRAHGVRDLIHGHTHRPGIHEFDLDGAPARRMVLGDWYEQDGVLVCDGERRELMRIGDYLAQ